MPNESIWGTTPPCQERLLPRPPAASLAEVLQKAAALGSEPRPANDGPEDKDPRAERRRDHRAGIQMPVAFRDGAQWEAGRTRDVSLGGMYVETSSPRSLGTRVVLEFYAGGLKEPLHTYAIVRWVERGNGMGLQFESPRPLLVWALQRELATR